MNIKKYRIEHTPTYGELMVEINFDHNWIYGDEEFTTIDSIKGMVDFWSNSEYRLEENDNDYVETFLKQLCEKCVRLSADYNLSVNSLINEFENLEGYCKMDGSNGIKIIGHEPVDLSTQYDYEITEL